MKNDFFDNAIEKTKDVFGAAYEKTAEVLGAEKIKFNISSLKSKRGKLFSKLGENYFLSLSDTEGLSEEDKNLYNEIVEINAKIADLNNELNYVKSKRLCPNCGAVIEQSAVYCSVCGAKLQFDSAENENEEV